MKGLIIVSLLSFLSLIFSKNNATSVLVFESAACGNCEFFNYFDVAYILKKQNFQEVVDIKLLPTAHLIEKKVNGSFVYSHRFGEQYLRVAFAQICANNLYDNFNALRWASVKAYARKNLNDTIRDAFPTDNGASMLNCVYGNQGHIFARGAWLEYMKIRIGGMLPIVIVDNKQEAYSWDENLFFFDTICKIRTDKAELVACNGIKKFSEENYDDFVSGAALENEIKENNNEAFDYQTFWSSPDDEETQMGGFESRNNAENKRQHLKFFDANDE